MIDAFAIGVRIAVHSNGSQVLSTLLRDLLGIHVAADKLAGKLSSVKIAAVGAAAALGGIAALRGLWDIVDAGKELNTELTKTNQLGGRFTATLAQAKANAFSASYAVPTADPAAMVRLQRELGTQLQSPEAGFTLAPMAAKTAYVISHYTGENQEDIIKNLVKVADLRAQIFSKGPDGREVVDPVKVASEFQAAARGLILGGGYTNSAGLVQMAKQAGVPVKTQTQEAFYAAGIEGSISMGAARFGTATTSLFSQMIGGKMTEAVAHEMMRVGLLKTGEEFTDRGGHTVYTPAASRRNQAILTDPIAFIEGPLNDRLTKLGMNDNEKMMEIFRLFGRQTTQRLVAEALSNAPQFLRARQMFRVIPGVDQQYQTLQNTSIDTNTESLGKAWKGFTEALSDAGTPAAIMILQHLTAAIQDFTKFSVAHPKLVTDLFLIAGALSALAVAAGGLAVAVTTIRILAGALSALGGKSAMAGAATLVAEAGGAGAPGIAAQAATVSRLRAATALGIGAVPIIGQLITAETLLPPAMRWAAHQATSDIDPSQISRIGSSHANQTLRSTPQPVIVHHDAAADRSANEQLANMIASALAEKLSVTPQPVHVTNPHDVATAVEHGLVGSLSGHAYGGSGSDTRVFPFSDYR